MLTNPSKKSQLSRNRVIKNVNQSYQIIKHGTYLDLICVVQFITILLININLDQIFKSLRYSIREVGQD